MGKAILVTGGARSGKSGFAEKLVKELGSNVLYIATAIPFDEEMKDRIKKHRESRPSEWNTHEGYRDIGKAIIERGSSCQAALLDCITVMVTNILFECIGFENENPSVEDFEHAEGIISMEFEKLREAIENTEITVVLVTNELGSGIVPENPLARGFRDIAGRINQKVAAWCADVYMTVCGIPIKIK